MKLQASIRTELAFVAAGLAVADALICLVAALLRCFDYTVALGAVWGSVFAWFSIYLLARHVQKVADCTDEAAQKQAQQRMRVSYFGRMMLMVFAVVFGIVVPFFNYIAALIPFLVPKPVLMLRRAIIARAEKRKGENS